MVRKRERPITDIWKDHGALWGFFFFCGSSTIFVLVSGVFFSLFFLLHAPAGTDKDASVAYVGLVASFVLPLVSLDEKVTNDPEVRRKRRLFSLSWKLTQMFIFLLFCCFFLLLLLLLLVMCCC